MISFPERFPIHIEYKILKYMSFSEAHDHFIERGILGKNKILKLRKISKTYAYGEYYLKVLKHIKITLVNGFGIIIGTFKYVPIFWQNNYMNVGNLYIELFNPHFWEFKTNSDMEELSVYDCRIPNSLSAKKTRRAHSLNLYYIKGSNLSDILHTLKVSSILTSLHLNTLSGLADIDIIKSFKLQTISITACPSLCHTDAFEGIPTVELNDMKTCNLHALRKCKNIILRDIEDITDLTPLSGIDNINIIHCHKIKNIQALSTSKKICIIGCFGIEDFSCLGSVPDLTLLCLDKLVDVSCLGNVDRLKIEYCPYITDVSALGNVRELHLRKLRINNANCLKYVKRLSLDSIHTIRNIDELLNIPELHISNCHGISERDYESYKEKYRSR